jgi:hypothetical protein
LAILTHKELSRDNKEKRNEVFEIGAVFEKLQRERDQEIENNTYDRIEKVMDMLERGIELEVISKETGVNIERVKRLHMKLK